MAASPTVRNIYDDEKITLEAKIDGTPTAVAKIKTVDFIVTTTKQGTDAEKPPISAPVEVGFPSSKATHEYTPDAVEAADDFYDLKYQAKITPPGRDPLLQPGSEEFKVWPTKVEITFTADDGKAHKVAKFKVVQGVKKGPVVQSGDDGKWTQRIDKALFEVELVAPWAFDGAPTHTGSKRSYKIKKNAYQFEFLAPKVADPAQKTKQYVNLDVPAAGWTVAEPFGRVLEFKVGGKGDEAKPEAERVAQKDDLVYIQVEFTPATKRNDPKPKLLDDGLDGAATSENSDKTWKGKAKLDAKGQATFKVDLGFAGGDVCKVKIGADSACGDATLEFETWRRLYYELLYADVMIPSLLDAGGGKHDLPNDVKTATDTRLAGPFVEYKLAAAHKYTEAQAHPGMIVDAAFIGKAGRKQVVVGGRISGADPVAFNAENDRTIHIKIADAAYSTNVSDNPQAPVVDASPFTWTSTDYLVPMEIDVTAMVWTAKIATPNTYRAPPTLSFKPVSVAAPVNTPYVVTIRETKQNKTLSLTYARDGNLDPVADLAGTEEAKIGPFILGLLGVPDLRKQDNKVELEITHPSDAGARLTTIQAKLQTSFDGQKPQVYNHPGLNDDGTVKSGPVDAAWFTAKTIDKVDITLPTSATNDASKPGDYVGPLSATKCPIEVKFKVGETYAINGNSSGVRQLFCYDSDRVAGALASTLCHELGHSMGMTIMSSFSKVPAGTDAATHVDSGGVYYINGAAPYTNGKRNIGVGPHCATGVPGASLADSKFNNNSGSCVMFHAGGNADTRPSYCDVCKGYLQARKLTDIRSDWSARTNANS